MDQQPSIQNSDNSSHLVTVSEDKRQEGNSDQNKADLQMQKKESLKRIALKSEFVPGRSSLKSLVTKNILNEEEAVQEIVFDTGLKLRLNPQKSRETLPDSSDAAYEPGKKRKQRPFLPPLLKNQQGNNRSQIKIKNDSGVKIDSSSQIVMKSDHERKPIIERQSQPIYRITTEIIDKRTFMTTPVPAGLTLQCTIRRDKSTFSKRFYTEYTMQISENFQFLTMAKRLPYHCNSTYTITLQQQHFDPTDKSCLGQVKSNFWGSLFEVHEISTSNPKIIATVRYESSCCKPSGPRCMSANITTPTSKITSGKLEGSSVQMLGTDNHTLTELVNKQPKYDQARKAYLMKFNHRVKKPSVKNFILVKKDDFSKVQFDFIQDILLFGKCNKLMWNLDISHPMTPMQAFAIALTSFDSKLVSQ